MLIIGIILLAFPTGIVLTAMFGRKYNDLTDNEKEIYHRIEMEKEKEMKRRRMASMYKPQRLRYTCWPLNLWND